MLGQRSEFVLKNNFGKRTVKEVVSGERDELMSIMLSSLNDSVKDLGVEIIDFRVKRIDLPSNLSNSVYERMRTERNRLAEEFRSEGKEIAREIRAVADKDKVVNKPQSVDTVAPVKEKARTVEPAADNVKPTAADSPPEAPAAVVPSISN